MDDALFTLYTAHVTMLKLRYDSALEGSKFEHAAIYSGALHYQFLDDMAYPFKPNPHFKCWVPVVDNPTWAANKPLLPMLSRLMMNSL